MGATVSQLGARRVRPRRSRGVATYELSAYSKGVTPLDRPIRSSLFDTLRDPLGIPRRTLEDLEAIGDAARGLAVFQRELLSRLDGLSEEVRTMGDELNESVDALKERFDRIDRRVADLQAGLPEVSSDLDETSRNAAQIRRDVGDVVEHLPGSDSRGPIAKVRDAITGDDADEDS